MKTPQQIKNEVEKGCGKIESIGLITYKCGFSIVSDSPNGKERVYRCFACRSKTPSQILTEYDKSIKEMIEEIIEKKKESLMNDNLIIGDWWSSEIFTGLEIDELLTKIGDNSEVEK